MKKLNLFLLSSAILAAACNNSSNSGSGNTDTSATATESAGTLQDDDLIEFVHEAAKGGMLEVELGKLAETQALNKRVKAFGAMMVKDHTQAGDELKALAATKNITVPSTLTEDQLHHLDELRKKKGVEFDKDYMKMMANDHRDDIEEFEKMANRGTDPEFKAFAAKTLPVLKAHLDSVKSINKEVKASVDPGEITDGVEVHPNR